MTASPRLRGWTLGEDTGWRLLDGFPAPAGMDPAASARARASWRLPRACGDGPEATMTGMNATEASPRLRGWTRGRPGRRDG